MCTHETSLMSKLTQERGSGFNNSEVNDTILLIGETCASCTTENIAFICLTENTFYVLCD